MAIPIVAIVVFGLLAAFKIHKGVDSGTVDNKKLLELEKRIEALEGTGVDHDIEQRVKVLEEIVTETGNADPLEAQFKEVEQAEETA